MSTFAFPAGMPKKRRPEKYLALEGKHPTVMFMDCRPNCGACCIAPSITSPIPGMKWGKPAGIPCVQLLPDLRCALFGKPERPAFCVGLRPTEEMCGSTRDEAMEYLAVLETQTRPSGDACQPKAWRRLMPFDAGGGDVSFTDAGGADKTVVRM